MTKDEALRLEPVKLRRGDILRCIETDELCTVWATSTSGKTLVKWGSNDFTDYTAEQIGELFWLEPAQREQDGECKRCTDGCPACDVRKLSEQKPYAFEASMYSNDRMKVDPVTGNVSIGTPQRTWVGLTDEEINLIYSEPQTHIGQYARAIEAKLKEKNS